MLKGRNQTKLKFKNFFPIDIKKTKKNVNLKAFFEILSLH